MALTTYAELKSAIAARVDRTDTATYVADWISIAEKEMSRSLRVSWLEKRSQSTPTSAFVPLPTDYNRLRNLQWDYSSYRVPLEQVSPDMIDKISIGTSAGLPAYYAIHDQQIELRPAPSATNTTTLEMSYYFTPTALSDANTSNEFLVNAPDALFYRALVEAHDTYFDDAKAAKYLQLYERTMANLLREDVKRTWGSTPMRVMADSLRGI